MVWSHRLKDEHFLNEGYTVKTHQNDKITQNQVYKKELRKSGPEKNEDLGCHLDKERKGSDGIEITDIGLDLIERKN